MPWTLLRRLAHAPAFAGLLSRNPLFCISTHSSRILFGYCSNIDPEILRLMATPIERRLQPHTIRRFGSGRDYQVPPDLTKIQTHSYKAFLQNDIEPEKRKTTVGIESVLHEIFPIESYDKKLKLSYVRYELGKPRYTPEECRQLRLTYGQPFRVWLLLEKEQPVEEEVFLGDIPIMLGGGEFIINGAERVVVSQLHRSPGIDFVMESDTTSDRKLPSCRVIPERGSWIEVNATKKDALTVRIDQSGKFSAITLLRAMDPKFSEDSDIIRAFYEATKVKVVDGRSASKLEGKIAVDDILYPSTSERAGEIIVDAGTKITKEAAEMIIAAKVKVVEIIAAPRSPLIFNSLAEDNTSSHEEALLRIYQRLHRATRLHSKKHARCLRKNSTIPIATVSAESVASGSIENLTWASPKKK